eukprot:scaffold7033_cov257-Pinguiococcus_pyrenoidosus.AAC.2
MPSTLVELPIPLPHLPPERPDFPRPGRPPRLPPASEQHRLSERRFPQRTHLLPLPSSPPPCPVPRDSRLPPPPRPRPVLAQDPQPAPPHRRPPASPATGAPGSEAAW